jgi:hypothetical protein
MWEFNVEHHDSNSFFTCYIITNYLWVRLIYGVYFYVFMVSVNLLFLITFLFVLSKVPYFFNKQKIYIVLILSLK